MDWQTTLNLTSIFDDEQYNNHTTSSRQTRSDSTYTFSFGAGEERRNNELWEGS